MNKKRILRRTLIFLLLIVLVVIARPVSFLLYTYYKDQKATRAQKAGYTNDASHLNETPIGTLVKVPENVDEAITQIAQLIKQASLPGKKISIAGAQHSMGGHTIYPNGIVLDMKSFHYMKYDSISNTLYSAINFMNPTNDHHLILTLSRFFLVISEKKAVPLLFT